MASTHHGMRRILKRPLPPIDFIRKAVLSGVYKTAHQPAEDQDRREKQEKVKLILPEEYFILALNPPIPMPPKVPKKFMRQEELKARRKDKTDRLVKNYLKKHDANNHADSSVDDYYRRLLGIPPPPRFSTMGQKSALLNKAYAVALKQQQLMRSNSALSENESLQLVEDLLQEESKKERFHSRKVQQNVLHWAVEIVQPPENFPTGTEGPEDDNDEEEGWLHDDTFPSVLHSKPRTLHGITIWSQRLRAVPYKHWTVGASVALDHFIAVSVLGVSNETWDTLLEGSDPALKSIAYDIVTTRRSLFPETDRYEDPGYNEPSHRDSIDAVSDAEAEEMEASIDELLASLGGFDDDADDGADTVKDEPSAPSSVEDLREDLQTWRAKQMKSDFHSWADADKTRFNRWVKKYVETLQGDDMDDIDWEATRDALLALPPTSEDESKDFWDSISDQTQAEIYLENLTQSGDDLLLPFWKLSHEERVRRLVALGSLRPILDEYADPDHRHSFLQRHADKLLEGLPLEHIVHDANGPIAGADLRKISAIEDVDDSDHFSIQKLPYESDKKGRALLSEWNHYKANRARFEEHLFKKGRLQLRYRDGILGRKKRK